MSKSRRFLMAAAVMLAAIFLTGCRISPYSGWDVRKYLWDAYSMWNIKLSKEAEEQDGKLVWTVVDKKNDVEFHVFDGTTYFLWSERVLSDDYEFTLIMSKKDELLEGYEDKFEIIDTSDNHYYPVTIQFHYSNLAELRERCDDLEVIYKRLSKMDKSASVTYESILDFERREFVSQFFGDWVMDDFDIGFKKQYTKGVGNDIYEQIKRYYVWQAYNYQWPELLADVTEEDIAWLMSYENMIFTSIVHEDESEELVPGVISYSEWKLTYGNLYLFLVNQGFEVSGDPTHYTVVAQSGITYEFSYDFVDDEGAYILVDGEVTRLENSDDSYYVEVDEIEEFFGYKKLYVR